MSQEELIAIHNIENTDQLTTITFIETTWDDIEKDFKSSGEKSYSVWLKKNYNVPTKL